MNTFNSNSAVVSFDIVAIGISTGGPQALVKVIPKLPANLGVPVIIVQHMPAHFTARMAEMLDKLSALTVVEGQHLQEIQSNVVYVAPGDKQMRLSAVSNRKNPVIILNDDPPENYCRPSADYLFRSVATIYPRRSLGVIMTGMGRDGTDGLKVMKRAGTYVIAQDKESSTVFGMPMEAIRNGVADIVLPLDKIAARISAQVMALNRAH